jgi:autotransporter adhesin
VTGDRNLALGTNAGANITASDTIAVGTNARATQTAAIAVGLNASSTGINAIAIGTGATASGSVAIGDGASASNGGAAFGDAAAATGSDSTAVGPGANATLPNSAAFGHSAVATRADQQTFGTASNTYTMAGITSAASKGAQSGPTQLVTSDAAGNLATATLGSLGLASSSDIGTINSRLESMQTEISTNRTEARRGVAAAMAMTTAPMPSKPGRTSWAINTATFLGEAAAGASLAYRLDTNVPMAITAGYGYGGGNSQGMRVGLQGEF